MNLGLLAHVLHYRARLRGHEQWSRELMQERQQRSLAELRSFALKRSPFYARFHRGLEGRPLEALPILTKALLMDSFDEIVTDRTLRLADIEKYLKALQGDEVFHERYWISATSGSSGRRSIIPNDLTEWATIIASYGRANEWSGVRISQWQERALVTYVSRW